MDKKWFTVKNLFPDIWGIAEFNHFEKVVSYLFVGDKKALLFDTGMGIGGIEKEVARITKLPITVINSHCHFDHIGGNYVFSNILLFDSSFSFEKSRSGYDNSQIKAYTNMDGFIGNKPSKFYINNYSVKPFKINRLIGDGEIVDIYPFRFVVIHTPGHSPDAICLYEVNRKILLTGDTFYNGPIYLHLRESDAIQYKKSITRLKNLQNAQMILPGHNDLSCSPYVFREYIKFIETVKMSEKKLVFNDRISVFLK